MPKNKPWKLKPIGRRPAESREQRQVLIVCEDSKSACFYFQLFPFDPKRVRVITLGIGMNTDSLVEATIDLKRKAIHKCQPYSDVWCVFDRDSFPLENYCRAFQLASSNGLRVAWANEAFEIWYLLHFHYHDTGIPRGEYKARLKKCNIPYNKADKKIYDKMRPFQEIALRHARRLEKYWNDLGEEFPERQNPSTGIHKLVEYLNEFAE